MLQGPETTQSNDPNMKVGQKTCRTEYEKQHLPGQQREAGEAGEAEDEGSFLQLTGLC